MNLEPTVARHDLPHLPRQRLSAVHSVLGMVALPVLLRRGRQHSARPSDARAGNQEAQAFNDHPTRRRGA